MFERVEIYLAILDLGTRWWVVSFTPRSSFSRKRAFGTQLIGDWVGPLPVWTIWTGEKTRPYRDSNFDKSSPPARERSLCWQPYLGYSLRRGTYINVKSLIVYIQSGNISLYNESTELNRTLYTYTWYALHKWSEFHSDIHDGSCLQEETFSQTCFLIMPYLTLQPWE
jgi:hypothetical protein